MSRDWTFYLEDILESGLKIQQFTSGLTLEQFRENAMAFDAVVRNLEIIGEAAKRLPEPVKAMMPDIEWSKAAAFRDVIAHHYFGLNVNIVWDVVQNKVPAICKAAKSVLESTRNNPP